MMQNRQRLKRLLEVEAIVRRVDPITRELAALVEGGLVTIYVPPDCEVVLHGERVKLRMVQPRDRLRVVCADRADPLIALGIEVQPAGPPLSLSR